MTKFSRFFRRDRRAEGDGVAASAPPPSRAEYEALQARAALAEKLLASTRERLAARDDEAKVCDRQIGEARRARNAAEVRLREIEAVLKAHQNHINQLERSRASLTERNASLIDLLKACEAQLAEAERQKRSAADQIGHLEEETKATQIALEARIEELVCTLDQERLERQVIAGALDATREERAQILHEFYQLRRKIRRGILPLETETPAESPEETGSSADAA